MRLSAKLVGMPRTEPTPAYVEPVAQETDPGLVVDLPERATVRDLANELARSTPQVDLVIDRVLVDGQEADLGTPLRDGAAVVFLGPTTDRQ